MDYEQFREQLAEEVQQSLYEKSAEDVNITFDHVEKMNGSYKLYNTNIHEKIAEQKKRDSQSKTSVD